MKAQTARKTVAESGGLLYKSRKMSVNLTPQKSALCCAVVQKTDAIVVKELLMSGKPTGGVC